MVAKKNEKSLDAGNAQDKSNGLVGIPVTAHGYAAGSTVVITGTTNYDGTYIVDASSTVNEVVIAHTFTIEAFDNSKTIHEAPGPDVNTMADLVEVAVGNGYTSGGLSVARDVTGFTVSEDDAGDLASTVLSAQTWTATGGNLPATGNGARYAVLTDDNATVANRNIYAYWDLVSDRVVSDGQSLMLQNCEIRLTE